ncbi:MAG TPA: hypothetical protein VFU07_05585 [Candidatus Lumbricidophila sp.]|nr:hypothetical protein [Candidatus Lumbricidophila sp.]
MANYVSQCRTNYFQIKDLDAFKNDLELLGIKLDTWQSRYPEFILDEPENKPAGTIALFSYEGWPSLDEDSICFSLGIDDNEDISLLPLGQLLAKVETIFDLVALHLADESIAVFEEVGFEKMRYLYGAAIAVNSKGERREVLLGNIYDLAKELLPEGSSAAISTATY